ncbi:GGDEF domain-containing protein [Pseudomonas nicosulfuronedens]|uniref:diguanylate cyclase n=1 Tax=Pseudomonas nicosulfuronedens TaxID=2571105 RepID=A0A5R9RRB8_9PSED|nr:GGDEF domain-containing protein [Pseudomonas nicosulfuronedens]MDH1007304.1 GGDEF domain-containing protein [Pseudomonas nicosulfuronedens]MDH1977350.1 GGDEF domain-containing protein [Pseudomonas nicosulfuronedens]MDH2029776.1 GGDEF domain-containing protein [Pseudomonas nicosulfuronedens]TLX79895.1 GGDEF domain-containing protein [Pseudomonas nicosulfuronedens]
MTLNLPTLVVVDLYVLTLVGVLMAFAWHSGRRDHTLGFMSVALLLGAIGTFLATLRGMGIDWLPILVGNVVLHLSSAMTWTSMRVFTGRKPHWPLIGAGAALWALLCLVPPFYESLAARIAVSTGITVIYCIAAISELWRDRRKLDVELKPTLALLLFHTLVYSVRLVVDRGMPFESVANNGQGSTFFTFLVFETMLFAIGIAFATLAMVKERAELQFRSAALSDPLTGVGNRRAFMETGERLLRLCAERGEQASLLLCDLDNFKRLNDSFGHPAGDRVLVEFSRITASRMRKHDQFARIGGEEFACLLVGADTEGACQVAERVRREFAELPFMAEGQLSVSIGIATSREAGHDLLRLLSLADQALYAAKAKGRNRIELAAPEPGTDRRPRT